VTKILFAVTACVLAVVGTAVSDAAEIKVLAAAPFKAALTEEFLPKFERETGSKVSVKFDLAASLKPQIEAGEPFDVAILTPTIIDDLIKSGKIDTKSRSIIARIGAGIAIRQGASKPDISTTEAFSVCSKAPNRLRMVIRQKAAPSQYILSVCFSVLASRRKAKRRPSW